MLPKLKSHKNGFTYQFDGTEYESDILHFTNFGILEFFIQNLNVGNLFPKLRSCWIDKKRIWLGYIQILHLKHKFKQIGPKIKVSLNLHENSHV